MCKLFQQYNYSANLLQVSLIIDNSKHQNCYKELMDLATDSRALMRYSFRTYSKGNPISISIESKCTRIAGNKCIAAYLFVWFLHKNDALYDNNGNARIFNPTLVAITLMIATSNSNDKENIIATVVNMIL